MRVRWAGAIYPVYIDYICYRDEQVPVYIDYICCRDEQVPVYSVNTVDTLYLSGHVCVWWACYREGVVGVPVQTLRRIARSSALGPRPRTEIAVLVQV